MGTASIKADEENWQTTLRILKKPILL